MTINMIGWQESSKLYKYRIITRMMVHDKLVVSLIFKDSES